MPQERKEMAQAAEAGALRERMEQLEAEKREAEERAARAEAVAAQREKELATATRKVERLAREQESMAQRQLQRQKKVFLTIHSTDADSTAVTVSVNGYAYRIRRDERVLVPQAVADVLKLAVMDKPVTERTPEGQTRTVFKHVNRFSYAVEDADMGKRAEDA